MASSSMDNWSNNIEPLICRIQQQARKVDQRHNEEIQKTRKRLMDLEQSKERFRSKTRHAVRSAQKVLDDLSSVPSSFEASTLRRKCQKNLFLLLGEQFSVLSDLAENDEDVNTHRTAPLMEQQPSARLSQHQPEQPQQPEQQHQETPGEEEPDKTCAICLCEMRSDRTWTTCLHSFHRTCHDALIQSSPNPVCPLCRTVLLDRDPEEVPPPLTLEEARATITGEQRMNWTAMQLHSHIHRLMFPWTGRGRGGRRNISPTVGRNHGNCNVD